MRFSSLCREPDHFDSVAIGANLVGQSYEVSEVRRFWNPLLQLLLTIMSNKIETRQDLVYESFAEIHGWECYLFRMPDFERNRKTRGSGDGNKQLDFIPEGFAATPKFPERLV